MRHVGIVLALVAMTATAEARPARKRPASTPLPKVGDVIPVAGAPEWPQGEWLYGPPSTEDAAGKVVIHWFCNREVKQRCAEDLAHLLELGDRDRLYVVAHVDGTRADAAKLADPLRDGGARGTVAFGKATSRLVKRLRITGPTSVVVDVDGKTALVAKSSQEQLAARDAKIEELRKALETEAVSPTVEAVAEPAPPPAVAAVDASPEPAVHAAAARHPSHSKVHASLGWAVPVLIHAEPEGKPAIDHTPSDLLGVVQSVALGYAVSPRVSVGVGASFFEVLRSDKGVSGWGAGGVSAIASVRLIGGLAAGVGPLMMYRRGFTYERDYGLTYQLAYRFALPARFRAAIGVNSPQTYKNELVVEVAPYIGISHGL